MSQLALLTIPPRRCNITINLRGKNMRTKRDLILSAVGLAVATMVTALVGGAPATAVEGLPDPPTVHITYNAGSVPKTDDAFDFRPGMVRLRVSDLASPWGSCPLWVVRLNDGYMFTQWRRDQSAAISGDLAAGARLAAKSEAVGGASTVRGHTFGGRAYCLPRTDGRCRGPGS